MEPPEHFFGNVAEDKLRNLIALAAAANLNMLRVNGCGTFESDLFYELCDEHGILVWQDFPFTSAYFPDDDAEFCELVREEAEDSIRRLRNHASLAIWCGSNENEWAHALAAVPGNAFGVTAAPHFYGERIYHEILPAACAWLDPGRPYLPSTPWSSGDQFPNSEASGCRHAWEYQLMRAPEDRLYFADIERDASKFVSEFGFLGPSEPASLRRFLPEDQMQPRSAAWQFHDNTCAEGVIGPAIERYWAPVESVDLEDYAALGQLFQGEAFGLAVRHWRRRAFLTGGAVSWGYVDCWGTTLSWSLVDYYERPRAAYFHAMRAFEPLQVSLKLQEDHYAAWIVNDLPQTQDVKIVIGTVDLLRSVTSIEEVHLEIEANTRRIAARLALPTEMRYDPGRFVAYAHVIVDGEIVSRDRASLVGLQFDRLQLPQPEVTVTRDGERIELEADSYIFQLHFSSSASLPSDNWFDLVPGEKRTITLSRPEEDVIRCWAFTSARRQAGRVAIADLSSV